jgi:hypothetical protein
MNLYPLNYLLVPLKKSIPAVLLLGLLSLAIAPKAVAQITFTVDEFTTDTLSITLNPGSLFAPETVPSTNQLTLFDATGGNTNTEWLNPANVFGSGGGAFGSAAQTLAIASGFDTGSPFGGDSVAWQWDSDLSTAGDLVIGLSFTFASVGAFNPANVDTWTLVWSDANSGPIAQSVGSALTGAVSSAVPEPSTYAALFGAIALGGAVCRRRGRTRGINA